MALATVGATVLFFCHLMGLLFFYVLIAGYEFEQQWPRRAHRQSDLARLAVLCRRSSLPLGLYLVSPLAPVADEAEFASLADKAGQLVFPFANYILPLDIATACAVGTFLLACIAKRRAAASRQAAAWHCC